MPSKYPHFSEEEFSACVPPCFSYSMNDKFMRRLEAAREYANVPFILNCAFRSKHWDVSHGRSGNSYHTKGRAVDIKCTDSHLRGVIVHSLLAHGFRGIGIAKNYIHVDDREEFCLFHYYD